MFVFNHRVPSLYIIKNKLFSLLAIIIILITISYILWVIVPCFFDREEGIVVQPFEISGLGDDLNGKALASLLSYDLQNIKEIYESGKESPTHQVSGSQYEIKRPLSELEIPSLDLKNYPLEYSVSPIGTVGLGGTSISIDNLLYSMRGVFGNRLNPVTCSLQKYNSTLVLIAVLEDHHSTKREIIAFRANRTLDKSNISSNEQIPDLINDLALQIAFKTGKRWASSKDEDQYPQTLQTFKYVTQARDAYNCYANTKNIDALNRGRDLALLARESEPSYSKSVELLWSLGFAYLNENKLDEATNIFWNITESKPFECELGLGLANYRLGNYNESLKAFNNATNQSPKNPLYELAWYSKGLTLKKLGKYDEAVESFDKAIRLNPKFASAWYNKGDALLAQNEFIGAIKASDKAIRLEPKNALAWKNKGTALAKQGKNEEAKKAFNEAIWLDPDLARATNGLI